MTVVKEKVKIQENQDLRERLLKLKGGEFKYKQLCEQLNIPYKRGNSKDYQLKEIALYCNIEVLNNPTRYFIKDVYDYMQLPLNGNNKFQERLETLIVRLLAINSFHPLYITNTQLLMSLSMVNENYKFIKNPKLRRSLEGTTEKDYSNILLGANKSGEILIKWVNRTLDRMADRGLIENRSGYCLFKKVKNGNSIFYKKFEVPNTPPSKENTTEISTEQRVAGCYTEALNKYSVGEGSYIPQDLKERFNSTFCRLIKEEFNDGWDGGYRVKIIVPTDPKRVKMFQNVSQTINKEAIRKIKETKQLDWMTGIERNQLIEEVIVANPHNKYWDYLKKSDKYN